MKGIDVSHWQGGIDWKKVASSGVEFAIMKASEATGFVDSRLSYNKKEARKNGILCGFYHFARGGNVKDEVEHFLDTVGDLREGELLVLDWEIQHTNTVNWCLEFLQRVEEEVGFKPIIYLNKATLRAWDWSSVVENDNGLWIASYSLNTGYKGVRPGAFDWAFWMMWQYTSRGRVPGIVGNVDLNHCDIGIDVLKKYGKVFEEVECNHCCPKHC